MRIAAVGWKPTLLMHDFQVDFAMYEFGDEFVAGYGIGSGHVQSLPTLVDQKT